MPSGKVLCLAWLIEGVAVVFVLSWQLVLFFVAGGVVYNSTWCHPQRKIQDSSSCGGFAESRPEQGNVTAGCCGEVQQEV